MSSPRWITRLMIAAVSFALCGGPEMLHAQQTAAQQQNTSKPPAESQNQNVGTTPENATPNPSRGPLQPVNTNLPNAPSSSSKQAPAQQAEQAPLGAAAAKGIETAGGPASRPAGTAIAPAKQHQTRSLLIKIGAIAAGAAALGAVYALSRSSPSTPPATNTSTAAVKGARH